MTNVFSSGGQPLLKSIWSVPKYYNKLTELVKVIIYQIKPPLPQSGLKKLIVNFKEKATK